ncbi:hypothetical protein [Fusobacterium animalis]|uniref:hypothetical protein n=1 Tax=Fusobacterium animalis TaxID=76859 RepID=UPI0030D54B2F
MGLFSVISGAIGGFFGSVGETSRTNVKKEETEFEKTQKYIKELEKKIEKEKNLKPESKLKDIKLDDVGENLNWQDLRSKQDIENDLKEEKIESKWEKLDKMLED